MQPKVVFCPSCHKQIAQGQEFCSSCGIRCCPHCYSAIPERSVYCPKCGFLCRGARSSRPAVRQKPDPAPARAPGAAASAPSQPSQAPRPAPARAAPASKPLNAAPGVTGPRPAPEPSPPPAPASPPQQAARNMTSYQFLQAGETASPFTCEQCGGIIDALEGQCTGCGLLYGSKHRALRNVPPGPPSAPGMPPPARPPGMAPRYSDPAYGPASAGSPADFPNAGFLGPMSYGAMAPPAPGAIPAAGYSSGMMDAMQNTSFRDEAIGPVSREAGAPRSPMRLLIQVAIIVLMAMLTFLLGAIIYYAVNESSPSPSVAADTTPPVISSTSVSSIGDTGATITWKTDEPATSQVMICDPGGVCTWSELKKSLDLSHSMAVNGLKVNTTYKYTTISKDSSGNEATAQGDLTTGAKAADTVPPSISGIAVTGITHSGAVIKWTSSEAATSQVEYGTTTAYGSASPLDSKLVTSHTVTLSGLSPDTTYHIMIRSKDSAGNEAVTRNDETFKTPPAVAVGLGVGNQPPDFALRNLAGQTVTLSEFRGKIVLINFWATWCGPCVGEMPDLQRIYETWPRDKLAILAIALRQGETEIQPFIADRGYTFPVLLDTAGTTSAAYAITSIPKTFFVDSAGIIRAVQNGAFGTSGQIETILNSIH